MTLVALKKKKYLTKTLVFLLGSIVFLTLLEFIISLVGAGYLYFNSPTLLNSKNTFNILCLGNSHTFGAGVNKNEAYPAVMQNFLNTSYNENTFNIINGGFINGNTSIILENMKSLTTTYKPQLVLVMVGQANFWNSYGYQDSKSDESDNSWGKNEVRKKLEKFHIFKFFDLAYSIIFKKIFDPPHIQNVEALQIIAKKEGEALNLNIGKAELIHGKNIIQNYISNFNESSPKNLNAAILTKIFIDQHLSPSDDVLIKDIEQLYKYENENYSYNTIIFFLSKKNYIWSKEDQFQKFVLMSQKVLSENNMRKFEIVSNILQNKKSQISVDQQLEYILSELAVYPANTFAAEKAYTILYSKKKYSEATQVIIASLNANPFSVKDISGWLRELYVYSKSSKKTIDDFLKGFEFKKNLLQFEVSDQNEKIMNWIEQDYQKIIDYYAHENIPMVIIGYHWLRNIHHESNLELSIEKIARNNSHLPYINLKPTYLSEAALSKTKMSTLYSTVMGPNDTHPSVEGHKLIAKLLIDFLVDKKLIPEKNDVTLDTNLLYQLHTN